jgi:hypothetical protein
VPEAARDPLQQLGHPAERGIQRIVQIAIA